ncbi:hypothetical protein BDW42DRAFT_178012 [Aspergillus taichungensis]|uniref:Uncharacterized protein n=1 Tax=Aspergillus taichungensis TaxID=482145 RepID=A0A2J5HIK7_9EURO|nr:hypothetical protein BDW42DRAFT_178012 [Aspergillus taichungensis]
MTGTSFCSLFVTFFLLLFPFLSWFNLRSWTLNRLLHITSLLLSVFYISSSAFLFPFFFLPLFPWNCLYFSFPFPFPLLFPLHRLLELIYYLLLQILVCCIYPSIHPAYCLPTYLPTSHLSYHSYTFPAPSSPSPFPL